MATAVMIEATDGMDAPVPRPTAGGESSTCGIPGGVRPLLRRDSAAHDRRARRRGGHAAGLAAAIKDWELHNHNAA
jgi:hypothetical protein